MANMVTDKQKAFIEVICEELDIEFHGKTKSEATKFISENIKEFKLNQDLNQIQYEAHGFIW